MSIESNAERNSQSDYVSGQCDKYRLVYGKSLRKQVSFSLKWKSERMTDDKVIRKVMKN